jgi:hypothetical protein
MAQATLINEVTEDETQEYDDVLETEETSDFTEEEATSEESYDSNQDDGVEEDDIPEKYRGKSLQEIIKMHQEAEKFVGRQSSEVGELRRVVDDFIASQSASQAAQPQDSSNSYELDDDVDFFTDPASAVSKFIENHPKIKQAEQVTELQRRQAAHAALQSKHPDAVQIAQDPSFQEWVQKSKIRTELFRKADQEYDFDSANELFELWKERKTVADQTVANERTARKNQAQKASTGSRSGSSESVSKKIYRRADIIKLMVNDPKRYNALLPEIRKAYAEDRVK